MIYSIKFQDVSKAPLEYTDKVFSNGQTFDFNTGNTIIVGENGCGKSTLLGNIYQYMLCSESYKTTLDNENQKLFRMTKGCWEKEGTLDSFMDGLDIKADYEKPVFRLYTLDNYKDGDTSEKLKSFDDFGFYFNAIHESTGNAVLHSIVHMMNEMFNKKVKPFPLKELKKAVSDTNDDNVRRILEYYIKNKVKSEKGFKAPYTVLMDEPDRNLDIPNIKKLYDVLSFVRPDVQLISVIHNPCLINRLIKLNNKDIHFMELTTDYLKKIKKFMKWGNME